MVSFIVTDITPLKEDVAATIVEAKAVSKAFSSPNAETGALQVVHNFSLRLREGELVTMFGPNGCGKTTILNLLAGLVRPDSGSILLNSGAAATCEVGYVFQNYSDTLLPWRSVRGNIALP